MERCKALLFLAVIIALVTVVPVMAECTVRPKGCTQLVDGEEVYVKFWTLQDCIDIMGPEYEDSCIIDSRPLAKNDGDLIEKEERSKTHHSRSSSIVPPIEPIELIDPNDWPIPFERLFGNALKKGQDINYYVGGGVDLIYVPSIEECAEMDSDYDEFSERMIKRMKKIFPDYFKVDFIDPRNHFSTMYHITGIDPNICICVFYIDPTSP